MAVHPSARPAAPPARWRTAASARGRGCSSRTRSGRSSPTKIVAARHFRCGRPATTCVTIRSRSLPYQSRPRSSPVRDPPRPAFARPARWSVMRVLYCTDTYPPQLNGVSVVTAVSVEGLTRPGGTAPSSRPAIRRHSTRPGVRRSGREVHGFASLPMPLYPEVRLARPRGADIGVLINGFRPDLVHCETEFGIGRHGPACGRRARERRSRPPITPTSPATPRRTGPPGSARCAAYLARFHRPEPPRVHSIAVASRSSTPRLWSGEVWGGESIRRSLIRGRRGAAAARDPRHGQPVHLRARLGPAGSGKAGRADHPSLPAWRAKPCPGSDPPDHGGDRSL